MRGSIVKRGDTYFCIYRVNGKQKWKKGGDTKSKAEKVLREALHDIDNGTYREIKPISFRNYTELWVESYGKTKWKCSTHSTNQGVINQLVTYFGDIKLTNIDPGMIQSYVSKKLGEGLESGTVINHLARIKSMFKSAVIWGYLRQNPATYVERPRVEKKEMEFLRPDEINIFLDKVDPNYYVLFLTAIETGLRRGELLALYKDDINWVDNQIYVRRSMWKGNVMSPKTDRSRRTVDITPYLAHELKKHILRTPPTDLVFCNTRGKPIIPEFLVRAYFLPALRRAGLRKVPFHALRHTNVALRLASGQDIYYIQRQLGHASIKTTLDKYGHLIDGTRKDAAQKLDDYLSGSVRKPLEKRGEVKLSS